MGLYRNEWAEALGIEISSPRTKDGTMVVSVISPRWDEQDKLCFANNGKGKLAPSLSFKMWEAEEVVASMEHGSRTSRTDDDDRRGSGSEVVFMASPTPSTREASCSPSPRCELELEAAAVKLQKVYKSYRTRRHLADCAVLVEELWWRALDFASLKHSSVSFFKGGKPETAASRWARASTRAAKLGKGLSKNGKAQKLALQHWLEAIDPRHRYGHNLHIYYDVWSKSKSVEPFFYWLDIGEGKEVNLEKCPRSKLQSQCIKYLGPKERQEYEVVVESGGKLVYKKTGALVQTLDDSKWIFVLSTTKTLYIGQKKKGSFQHSSFLAGGAITSAGRLVVKEGILKAIWPYSGHYLPTEENFKEFILYLEEKGVNLTDVKKCPFDKDDEYNKPDAQPNAAVSESDDTSGAEHKTAAATIDEHMSESEAADGDVHRATGDENMSEAEVDDTDPHAHTDSEEEAHSSDQQQKMPPECSGATELGKNHKTCRWSTGTGPRIRCVRDYPQDLQSRALEQVNLSPRLTGSLSRKRDPVPSPRPSPTMILSPRLASVGFQPQTTVSLTLPDFKRSRLK
ncbi:hypothetical protein BS78_09G078100 [Paspalum vaginatum]|nr:hypothetical protein BS78_09G078100 [Paspalum vaginatum]KAJ1262055.1 hypothetical protein BS78_09G078100 [Paspalum vaginatum]